MKKITIVILAIALFMIVKVNAQTIVGSAHDFSVQTWNTSGEICKVCHTPHNAVNLPDAPLWNHELTTQTFTTYSSATMTAVVGQPDASSKLCLSCHDGTVALENFGGTVNGTHYLTGSTLLGTDISNDHPISFIYDATLASTDGGLFNPVTTPSGLGGTINENLLFSGKMQCASCHDVHNNAPGTPPSLLLKSNAASALCLTCHNK